MKLLCLEDVIFAWGALDARVQALESALSQPAPAAPVTDIPAPVDPAQKELPNV